MHALSNIAKDLQTRTRLASFGSPKHTHIFLRLAFHTTAYTTSFQQIITRIQVHTLFYIICISYSC